MTRERGEGGGPPSQSASQTAAAVILKYYLVCPVTADCRAALSRATPCLTLMETMGNAPHAFFRCLLAILVLLLVSGLSSLSRKHHHDCLNDNKYSYAAEGLFFFSAQALVCVCALVHECLVRCSLM